MTDNPHILSGDCLVVFDPHQRCLRRGGVRVKVTEDPEFKDQFAAFSSLLTDLSKPFNGTIVRLPLRTAAGAKSSKIKNTSTSPTEISKLFTQFAMDELQHTLLFLRHVARIELREVDVHGVDRLVARASIEDAQRTAMFRSLTPQHSMAPQSFVLGLLIEFGDNKVEHPKWRILHAIDADSEAASLMEKKGVKNAGNALNADKLFAHVALATPLLSQCAEGRLFTLLPLPIMTGFPIHIHSVFALTQDRQNLRKQDSGLMEGSRDQCVRFFICVIFSIPLKMLYSTFC